MKYSPKAKNKKCAVISLVLLLTSVLLFAFAATGLTRQVAVLQLIGVVLLALASFFMIKNITVFTYMIIPLDSEDSTDYSSITAPLPPEKLTFTVSKRFGSGREAYQLQLDMASLKSATMLSANKENRDKVIEAHGKMNVYKYVATIGPAEAVLLVFHKRGFDKTAVIIEPDNSMYQYLRTVADINKNAPVYEDEE